MSWTHIVHATATNIAVSVAAISLSMVMILIHSLWLPLPLPQVDVDAAISAAISPAATGVDVAAGGELARIADASTASQWDCQVHAVLP